MLLNSRFIGLTIFLQWNLSRSARGISWTPPPNEKMGRGKLISTLKWRMDGWMESYVPGRTEGYDMQREELALGRRKIIRESSRRDLVSYLPAALFRLSSPSTYAMERKKIRAKSAGIWTIFGWPSPGSCTSCETGSFLATWLNARGVQIIDEGIFATSSPFNPKDVYAASTPQSGSSDRWSFPYALKEPSLSDWIAVRKEAKQKRTQRKWRHFYWYVRTIICWQSMGWSFVLGTTILDRLRKFIHICNKRHGWYERSSNNGQLTPDCWLTALCTWRIRRPSQLAK